ncbi:MAG: dihydrolipoamide acetyltransferase family protein [Anaerolineae bacterium]
MATELIMPQLGESVVEGIVSRWLKKEGEEVKAYEPLLEVETDKVTTEVPSPVAGVMLRILVPEGTTVPAGTLLALIGEPGEEVTVPAGQIPVAAGAAEPVGTNGSSQAGPVAAPEPVGKKGAHVTPVVARIAAEHGIDVSQVPGSGRGGRVTKKDILAFIEGGQPVAPAPVREEAAPRPWETPGSGDLFAPTDKVFARASGQTETPAPQPPPAPTPAQAPAPAPGEVLPLSGMRKAIAEHMVRSKHTSPHVTTVMEVDCSRIWAFREQHKAEFLRREGIKLTFTPFFVAATVAALKAVPIANSRFTEQGIELIRQINLGVAVALDDGLIVPIIKDADMLNFTGLQRAVTNLADRARRGQLTPEEVQGGTFTITNHGTSGSLLATPIINQPQVGILGVGAIEKRVVVVSQNGGDSIAIKPMCYLSFTFDHRVLDGAGADRFLAAVKRNLENWQ